MENSNNLELLRSQLGLSNRDFASKIGIHETMYTKIKSGNYPIGDKTINKIKKAFPKYNPDWILFNIGSQNLVEEVKETNLNTTYMKDQKDQIIDALVEKISRLEEELEVYRVIKRKA